MTKAEQRDIAQGAVRSQLQRMGVLINRSVSFDGVLHMLDDLHRAEPDLVASQSYIQATNNQIRALRRKWKQQFSAMPNKVKQPQPYIRSMYRVSRTA